MSRQSNRNFMNKYSITLLILIILVIVAGVGVILFYDQPSFEPEGVEPSGEKDQLIESDIDTSNWKTYRNQELGFEFRYPKEWQQKETVGGVSFTIPSTENTLLLNELGTVNVTKSNKSTNELLEAARLRFKKPWQEELGQDYEVKEQRMFDNQKDITILGPASPPSSMSNSFYIAISVQNKQAAISTTIFGGSLETMRSQIELIAKSMTFFN